MCVCVCVCVCVVWCVCVCVVWCVKGCLDDLYDYEMRQYDIMSPVGITFGSFQVHIFTMQNDTVKQYYT